MFEDIAFLNKIVGWAVLPVTAAMGVLTFQNKRNSKRLDELDKDVTKLTTYNALNHKDITYIKQSCDLIRDKLDRLEDRVSTK